ncbi:MAG: hypothetical protein JW803_00745 [Endomicrobiales bacterium]|nr:hypothetical protein [Endomicrobiales bacterium]
MLKKIIAVIVLLALVSPSVPAREGELGVTTVEESTSAPKQVGKADSEYRLLNTAISDLNYKLEMINRKCDLLSSDIEAVRAQVSAQKKMLGEGLMNIPDKKKIESLENESALMRSEITQIREDISVIKRGKKDVSVADERKEKVSVKWVAYAALGLALAAIIVRK